eukprot:Hpha_TRINITY_DN16441_c4_g2::TRINITY_DN16441_c4_g2_i1::g.160920::m.160920
MGNCSASEPRTFAPSLYVTPSLPASSEPQASEPAEFGDVTWGKEQALNRLSSQLVSLPTERGEIGEALNQAATLATKRIQEEDFVNVTLVVMKYGGSVQDDGERVDTRAAVSKLRRAAGADFSSRFIAIGTSDTELDLMRDMQAPLAAATTRLVELRRPSSMGDTPAPTPTSRNPALGKEPPPLIKKLSEKLSAISKSDGCSSSIGSVDTMATSITRPCTPMRGRLLVIAIDVPESSRNRKAAGQFVGRLVSVLGDADRVLCVASASPNPIVITTDEE